MSTVIAIENLGKKYLLRHQSCKQPYVALRDVISDGVRTLGLKLLNYGSAPACSQEKEDFWALKDVSFEVKQGDRVGIIGRNGAGKSTLLKILSRITEPTTGSVRIKGRVASLLEVGTGFHPELTGRENIFLNGAILGMSRIEIKKKFDEIVNFAEVEKFLDTPVKRYSSGMYVRLAFAVAAHMEPEVLVVDEVLAVGDAQFQKKCLGKMEQVSAREGRTVLFVSHNMAAVTNLCSHAVWLDQGAVRDSGDTQRTVTRYLSANQPTVFSWERQSPSFDRKAVLSSITISDHQGKPRHCHPFSQPFFIDLVYEVREPLLGLAAAIRLKSQDNVCILVTSEKDSLPVEKSPRQVGVCHARCHFPGQLFKPGRYLLNVGLFREGAEVYDYHEDVVAFEISPEGSTLTESRDGILTPQLKWEMQVRNV